MNMRNFLSILTVLFALGLTGCGATNPPVSKAEVTKQQKASQIKIRNAIIRAGHQQGWKMTILSPSEILATRYKSGFMARTAIRYNHDKFSLNFKAASRQSFYDEWVNKLENAIENQLDKG